MVSPELLALVSESKTRVLELLLLHPERDFYQREIAERTEQRLRSVQQALAPLVEAGIITREERGNQVFYRANPRCPVLPELTGLIVKTVGIAGPLRGALTPLGDGIDVALVFGSFAAGRFRATSDVDLLVIGQVSPREVVSALPGVTEEIGREINAVVMARDELHERAARGDHFLEGVLARPTVPVIGDSDELAALAAGEPDRAAPDEA